MRYFSTKMQQQFSAKPVWSLEWGVGSWN